jgi:anti-sigma factor RsiW
MKADFSKEDAKFFPVGERFELLSAYIDNQVTPSERKQVQEWLDSDREFKRSYLHLLHIAQSIKNIPVAATIPSEELSSRVFAKIDNQRQNKQFRIGLSLSVLAVLGCLLYIPRHFTANSTTSEGESLAIALNRPLIRLPQALLK